MSATQSRSILRGRLVDPGAQLANEAVDAEEKKKRAGTSTTLAVEQVQANLASVEFNVSSALASERQAAAVYFQQIGMTLEHYQIKLADE